MEKRVESKLNKHIVRRALVIAFCAFVGICVSYVLLRVYTPSKNSLGALSSVCMDAICILILFIITGSFALDNYGLKRTTRLFMGMLVSIIWALFLDFLNWAFDGSLELGHLTYWFTLGSLCMGAILAGMYALYIYSYMEETHGLSQMRSSAIVCAVLNVISFVMTFILAITGNAFQFVDGHYETGAFYDLVDVIPVVTLLYMTGYVVVHIKQAGIHDTIAVVGYILFMMAGAIIEAVYNIGTTYVSMSIADIFIFIMLQNEIIAREKRNVEKWMEKSKIDGLTGFRNRYAYEADMKVFESSEISDNLIYVSADVNSLKMVNDTLGHSAGDELIKGAAECLDKCLGSYGKLYRTGGDEFIGLLYANNDQLETMKKEIKETVAGWSGELVDKLTISVGYVSVGEADGMTVRQMAVMADKRMYEDKREYYRQSGIERRRR